MINIRLMGGLGNQMFQYAALRAYMIENKNDNAYINLIGITNKTHNIYSLDHFRINKDIKVIKKRTIKNTINHLIYGYYYLFLINKKNGYDIMKKINHKYLYKHGMYCCPDGYIELKKTKTQNIDMIGYFASWKYFDKYKDIIKQELQVTDKILDRNKKYLKDIKESNSICLHIRRGDYVGTSFQVCTKKYYYEAIETMNKKVKNAKYFIFSDDIEWVKNNMDFGNNNIIYIEGKNPNYEELRLMYSCKNFIISNSTFSWWAQYLSDNKKRIIIAPSKWSNLDNKACDFYQDDWIKINV